MRKVIELPFKVKEPILACGADMKGAFALAKDDTAYLFDGFGDLSDIDNFTRYEKAIREAIKKLKIEPGITACDLHPGYFSTQFAENLQLTAYSLKLYKVQHHEAHIAAAIADNAIKGRVFGVAFDGTGFGIDGNIWGGEFFAGSVGNFKRIAHLGYIRMPGGEACVREPWRMAASYLYSVFGSGFSKLKIDFVKDIDRRKWPVLKELIDKKINSPLVSSAGRLFDAVASLVLNKRTAHFEAELPIELEKIAQPGMDEHYDPAGTAKVIKGVVKDLEKKVKPSIISARFHNTLAAMILNKAKKAKIEKIVLSGGVFQNKYLNAKTAGMLEGSGFKVYVHSKTQTNDSGIPIGQIAIAGRICV